MHRNHFRGRNTAPKSGRPFRTRQDPSDMGRRRVVLRTSAGRPHCGGCSDNSQGARQLEPIPNIFPPHTSFLRSHSAHPQSHQTRKPRRRVKSDSRNFSSATPRHTHSTCHECPVTHQSGLRSRVHRFKGGVRGGQPRHQTSSRQVTMGGVWSQKSCSPFQRRSARRPASPSN